MKGKLIEIRRIPRQLRDTHCVLTQYEADGMPTEEYEDAEFEVTIRLKYSSPLYGYRFVYCRSHLALFTYEVEDLGSKVLKRTE